jgi:hypothetical protein
VRTNTLHAAADAIGPCHSWAYHPRVIPETLLAKLLGWIPAPWSGVRLGHDATAELCTFGHPIVFFVGLDEPLPRGPLHVDLTLRLWSKTAHRTTVREVKATAAGQHLRPDFREMTLDEGAKPEEQTVELHPPEGEELAAGVGDRVKVELLLTRGRRRKLKLPIVAESSGRQRPPKASAVLSAHNA